MFLSFLFVWIGEIVSDTGTADVESKTKSFILNMENIFVAGNGRITRKIITGDVYCLYDRVGTKKSKLNFFICMIRLWLCNCFKQKKKSVVPFNLRLFPLVPKVRQFWFWDRRRQAFQWVHNRDNQTLLCKQ